MFDTHCHLQFNAYKDDREAVIARCAEKGMFCNVVGTQKDTSAAAVALAESHDFIYATIGLHPIHTTSTEVDEEEIIFKSREENFDEAYYAKLSESKKVIAVGECGLELFHLPPGADKNEILAKQKKVFIEQINFARAHDLALVIHIRDAYEETAEVLSQADKTSLRGVVHCYTGNWQNAAKFLDLGLYLGFTGVITFPPKKTSPQAQFDLIEVVKNCPLDKILIETDAPYLAPQAYRGQRCEPWMVEEVAKKIAELRGLTTEEVLKITDTNARQLFRI